MTFYLLQEVLPGVPVRLGLCLALFGLFVLTPVWAIAKDHADVVNVYSDGDAGFPRFRIPVLVALEDGVLLAFAEGRRPTFPGQHDDHAQNAIVLRQSHDGGKTWSEVQVIADMGGDSLNDPCAVVLPDSGRILLMFQRFPEGYHARRMVHTEVAAPGYDGPKNTQTFLVHSDDNGVTWSPPRDITRSVRQPDAISVGSPGVGIVLTLGSHSGRILLPLYEVIPREEDRGQERYWRNRVAISDDQGVTWRVGDRVPIAGLHGFGNESQLAELADGSVRMHSRLQGGENRLAKAVSRDGGETWTNMEEAPGLITTPCMTSLIGFAVTGSSDVGLLASLPHSETGRENGTLFLSRDGGETWPYHHTIYPGGFAYSSLAVLPDGNIGCLFERGPYEYLSYTTIRLDALLQDGEE